MNVGWDGMGEMEGEGAATTACGGALRLSCTRLGRQPLLSAGAEVSRLLPVMQAATTMRLIEPPTRDMQKRYYVLCVEMVLYMYAWGVPDVAAITRGTCIASSARAWWTLYLLSKPEPHLLVPRSIASPDARPIRRGRILCFAGTVQQPSAFHQSALSHWFWLAVAMMHAPVNVLVSLGSRSHHVQDQLFW